ncbi:MAG: hypothetical protein R3F33_05550 [Planctomycetota bacterium]
MGSFSTADNHPGRWQQPVSVPINKVDAFQAACEMVADLEGWQDVRIDAEALSLTCTRAGGLLRKAAKIRVWTVGPDGIPSSQTHCSSETDGGLFARDQANVTEFIRKLYMRTT